jgi:energy-coupling factor transporter ATP-binding protein EcfA2
LKSPILISSDWHVHPWAAHAEFDGLGVPDRLRDFLRLAEDVAKVGTMHGAESLVLAGDLLQVNSPKPMAANTLRGMLDVLCGSFAEVLVIPGNHDMDQKSGGFDTIHSGLRAVLPGHPNLFYFDEPVVHVSKSGRTIYFRPWVHNLFDYDSFESADIFVGHGLVVGTRDPFGHTFNAGFKAEELFCGYRLSVVGDIHSGQVLRSQDGLSQLLIPGQPIQLNHSSDPNCGLWLCDPSDFSLKFVSQSEYPSASSGHRYHRFYSVSDPSSIPADHGSRDHYKVKAARSSGAAPAAPRSHAFSIDLESVIVREWHALKPEHPALGEKLVKDLLTSARPNSARPPRSAVDQTLERMTVRNFLSIDEADFDFASMPGGDVLVAGPNGSGKTSLFEAFYWCYTGKTTKDLSVDKISNNRLKSPAFVSCKTRRADGVYEVRRSRDPKSLLEVWKDGCNISKSSNSDTQEWIYESLLGLDGAEDILLLTYFSVSDASNFSSFTPAEQFKFLGRLTDSELYEAFRGAVEERFELLSRARSADSGSLATIDSQISAKEDQLATIVSAQPPDIAAKLRKYRDELDDQSLANLAAVRDRAVSASREAESRVNRVVVEKHRTTALIVAEAFGTLKQAESAAKAQESALAGIQVRIKSAEGSKCPECGQGLHDDSLLVRLKQLESEAFTVLSGSQASVAAASKRLSDETARLNVLAKAKANSDAAAADVTRLSSIVVSVTADMSASAAVSQEERKGFIVEEIDRLRAQRDSIEAGMTAAKPELDSVKLIKDKLTVKNSPVVSKIVSEVFSAVVAGMNEAACDPSTFSAKAVTGNKRFDVEASFRGEASVTLDGMSVGERRLVDVLMLFSLNQIFCRHFGLAEGLFGISAYDEVFNYLDPRYLDVAFDAISSSPARLRFVITHDEALASHYSRVVRVRKDGGFTRYAFPES